MRRRRTVLVLVACLGLMLGMPGRMAGASPSRHGVITKVRSYVVPLVPGVQIKPLLSSGDVVQRGAHPFQFSGVPDGLGAYRSSPKTVEVYVNHELNPDDDHVFSKVDHLTLNNNGATVRAGYVVNGTEGYLSFCSSTLTLLRGTHWYTTGEEDASGQFQGTSIAVDTRTGKVTRTPQFGHMLHENVVPMRGLPVSMTMLMEDGRPRQSQLWASTASTFRAAVQGRGTLRVFVARGGRATADSALVAKNQRVAGRFVAIPASANRTKQTLDRAAERIGAMHFYRVEDGTADPAHKGRFYFSETGAAHTPTLYGRVWRVDLNPRNPTHGSVRPILDGDHGDDMVQPDNLGISRSALVIQEDRNYKRSGYDRVLVYRFADKSLTAVARTQPTKKVIKKVGIGNWETSGVINVAKIYGHGMWLMDVQAHDAFVRQQGMSLKIDSTTGERGQLLLMKIPGT